MSQNGLNKKDDIKPQSQYVSYGKVKKVFDISPQTLKNWAKNNIIDFKVIKNSKKNTWLYNIESIGKCCNNSDELDSDSSSLVDELKKSTINSNNENFEEIIDDRSDVIYIRISNTKNQEFYDLQKNYLMDKYNDITIFEDIDTSMNCNRTNLTKLIDMIFNKKIKNVIIYDSSRISYHGYELFKTICKHNNCNIIIDNSKEEKKLFNDFIFNEFYNDINNFSNGMNKIYKNKNNNKSNFDHKIIIDTLYNKVLQEQE